MNQSTEFILLTEGDAIMVLEDVLYNIPYSPTLQRHIIEIDETWYKPVDAADIIKENEIIRVIYLELEGPQEFSLR
jgi:hypothetical protein